MAPWALPRPGQEQPVSPTRQTLPRAEPGGLCLEETVTGTERVPSPQPLPRAAAAVCSERRDVGGQGVCGPLPVLGSGALFSEPTLPMFQDARLQKASTLAALRLGVPRQGQWQENIKQLSV